MIRHMFVGLLCLLAVTVPCDLLGVHGPVPALAGALAGLGGTFASAWLADRRARRR